MKHWNIFYIIIVAFLCLIFLGVGIHTGKQDTRSSTKTEENMRIFTLMGTLKADKIAEYERYHDDIPDVIVQNLHLSGVYDLKIYRYGKDVCLIYHQGEESPEKGEKYDQQAEDKWQAETGVCFESEPKWVAAEEIFDLRDH
jgi:L-rhamnose mutarotase